MLTHTLSKVLSLCLLPRLVLAISRSIEEGGTQFINFNGTISGTFTHSRNTSCGDGGTYYFNNPVNTTLRIGVNPPWDSNPFFFEFAHDGNDGGSSRKRSEEGLSKKDVCLNALGGCTYDAVYNLQLSSAYYLCQKDGHGCGWLVTSPWYYVGLQMLNLNAATITNTTGVMEGSPDPVPMYMVKGDEKTWVGNGTREPDSFDFQRPRNYSRTPGCVEAKKFTWNQSNPFTYAFNFTNTTSTALFTLSDTEGNITLSFAGSRYDQNDSGYQPYNGNYTAMSLDSPANHSKPHFTFANGTQIKWDGKVGWTWDAESSSLARMEFLAWGTLWCVTLGVITLNSFV